MTRNKTCVRSFIGLLTIMFFVFILSAAIAEEKENKKTEPASEEKSAGLSGIKVGKDPDGAERPLTKAEENKLNAELKKTLSKYSKHSPKQKEDGSFSLVIAPHSMHATVAHTGPDGKIHYNCTDADGHVNTNPETKEELPEE